MITTTGSPWLSAPVSLSLTASGQEDAIRQTVGLWNGCEEVAGTLPLLVEAVLTREALMSTALPNGVALPHTRSPVIRDPLLAIGRLATPVDFAGTPVWLVIAMASPAGDPAKHLELLNWLSRMLASGKVLEALRAAATPGDIRTLASFR